MFDIFNNKKQNDKKGYLELDFSRNVFHFQTLVIII